MPAGLVVTIGEDSYVDILTEELSDWRPAALCNGKDPEFFFPSSDKEESENAKYCNQCPVRVQCLEWSLANREPEGIWGGVSSSFRRTLLTQLRRRHFKSRDELLDVLKTTFETSRPKRGRKAKELAQTG